MFRMRNVGQKREQVEVAGRQVGSAHHACHRLGVDGVGGEKEAGDGRPH